jgi:hypothetical protein
MDAPHHDLLRPPKAQNDIRRLDIRLNNVARAVSFACLGIATCAIALMIKVLLL